MQTKDTIDSGLVVPVDIAALCVGIIDQNDKSGTSTFAGATTVFTNQSGNNNAYVGTNVVRALSAAPWQQLTTGVHLHWNLPEALTQGANSPSGSLLFGAVPNRWLISRLLITKNGPVRSSWIIQSDSLSNTLPTGQLAVTLPVKKINPTDQDYKYVGMYKVFDSQWTDPANNSYFRELTGQDLSAVSSGDSSFAAFYPNSRSLFGFQDTLSDLKIGPNDPPVDLMYEVTGWFSNTINDPLHDGKTREQINNDYNWTYDGPDETSTYSLYSGIIQNISYTPYQKYVVDQPNQKPVDAVLAIGNTPPECFAAYFKDLLHPDTPFFETLLNAFQNGLLSEFMQLKTDQLAQLNEVLHQKTFASISTGTVYQITRPAKDSPDEPDVAFPLPLAEALDTLNVYQQQVDFYERYTLGFQWQLFADWYRMVNTKDANLQNTLFQLIYNSIGNTWPSIQATSNQLATQLNEQTAYVNELISTIDNTLQLKETSPARYWQPNEPVMLVIPANMTNAVRGKSIVANYDDSGYLKCRTVAQIISAIVVNNITVTAGQFSSAGLPSPNNLPYPAATNSLLLESLLLNTNLVSGITGVPASNLEAALNLALNGQPQQVYTFSGVVPAALEVYWWHSNPWFPVFTEWSVRFAPLEVTERNGQLYNYTTDLFTANYTIAQNNGGSVVYKGAVNPATIDFSTAQQYRSSAIISTSAAETFYEQLEQYLEVYPNQTLQQIADALQTGIYASNAFSGFNSLLGMMQQSMQLNINVTPQNPYYSITQAVAQIAGKANAVSPVPNGSYNPVRAGFFEFSLSLIDVFGQKRTVNITRSITSEQLTTIYKTQVVPNIVYMPPALAQPSRLLFRWMSAIGNQIQEMNAHPATTPICGWILPNHLNGSLFIYDQQGRSMGTLGMNGNQTAMVWQSAPGNNATINQSIEQVFALQNPNLRDFAVALYNNGPEFFSNFWKAVDNMHNFIDPSNYAQSADLAVLIGRPIALGEAMLRLELNSSPVLNQSWATLTSGEYRTDNQFTDVRFPVILGDLNQVNDGLIGYFLDTADSFNFSTFYTEGAASAGTSGVVKPVEDTITLKASPGPDSPVPYDVSADARYVLMLFDPRAAVHATMGILPTKVIDIPSNLYSDTLNVLEMTFLTTPVLKGVTGFNMPVPEEEGYQWSWVEEAVFEQKPVWEVTPEISYVGGEAIAAYTPQTIREGWLKLTPELLHFELLNDKGQPLGIANAVNTFYLAVSNRKPLEIIFKPASLPKNVASAIYIHLGQLVSQKEVPDIQFSAEGWAFRLLNDTRYGNFWVANPTEELVLNPKETFKITLSNVKTTNQTGQVQMYFEYLNVAGVNDGLDAVLITLS